MGETEERWFGASVETLGRRVNRNFASRASLDQAPHRGVLRCATQAHWGNEPLRQYGQRHEVGDVRKMVFGGDPSRVAGVGTRGHHAWIPEACLKTECRSEPARNTVVSHESALGDGVFGRVTLQSQVGPVGKSSGNGS
jgi:hypothetical protein